MDFWKKWNELIRTSGNNPFYLGGYVEYHMRSSVAEGWIPQLIVMEKGERIVGGAALRTRGIYGWRIATSLLPRSYDTDFVVDPDFRERFAEGALKLLFGKLRCQYLDLTLPGESPNLGVLGATANSLGLAVHHPPPPENLRRHYVVEVRGTWDEFKSSKGIGFTRRLKEVERMLRKAGSWNIKRLALDGPGPERIINTVEKNSWKEGWRRERGERSDPNLPDFAAYWRSDSAEGRDHPRLWVLELNGEPIAYNLATHLNGVVLMCKTSYDSRYGKLSPGEYVQNAAVQDCFDSGEISKIDLLSDLPYMRRWASMSLTRERLTFTREVPVVSPLVRAVIRSERGRALYRIVRHGSKT